MNENSRPKLGSNLLMIVFKTDQIIYIYQAKYRYASHFGKNEQNEEKKIFFELG